MSGPPAPDRAVAGTGWVEVLDLLERQAHCERIESLPGTALAAERLDPQALGPLPEELADRAREVLARRDKAAQRFAAQLAALRGHHQRRSASPVARPHPSATDVWA